MKLNEIVNRRFSAFRTETPAEVKSVEEFLSDGAERVSSAEGGRYSIWRKNQQFYFIKAGDEIAGWIGLTRAKIADRDVRKVGLLWFKPKYRGTRAVAVLLQAVKHFSDLPIALSHEDAVFKGGADLLAGLVKRGMVKMSAIHADGTTTSVQSLDDVGYRDGLLIEDVPPLTGKDRTLLGEPSGRTVIFEWFSSAPKDVIE